MYVIYDTPENYWYFNFRLSVYNITILKYNSEKNVDINKSLCQDNNIL